MVKFLPKQLVDASVQIDRSNLAESIVVEGDNGSSVLYPADAPGRVALATFAGTEDQATLTAVAQRALTNASVPTVQVTAAFPAVAAPQQLPYRDFHVGSYVTRVDRDGVETIDQVADMTLTQSDTATDFGGNATLGQKLKSTQLKLVEIGKVVTGGASVSGSGTLPADPVTAAQLPFQIARGSVMITPSAANTPTPITVTFPAGLFSSAPSVTASPNSVVPGTEVLGVSVNSITASSMRIFVTRANVTPTGVLWIAVGD